MYKGDTQKNEAKRCKMIQNSRVITRTRGSDEDEIQDEEMEEEKAGFC